ncbi:MAG: tetratricopeptide repeat protein, partial [Lentisphaerota bacterium]
IDLDLGAANLHTMFGIKTTDRGIGDFIFTPKTNDLADYAVDTGIPKLRLISGNGFIPGIANLTYAQKIRILKGIIRLKADAVILDLGAGTSYNVIDFFSLTESGIIVTVSEPTAILNAYEFLKNVLFRVFHQRFKSNLSVLQMIDAFKINPGESPTIASLARAVGMIDNEAGKMISDICRRFRPGLVINMSRDESMNLGQSLHDICQNFLSLDVDFLGAIPTDAHVHECFLKMRPVTIEYPGSPPSRSLREIARKCVSGRWAERRNMDLDSTDRDEDSLPVSPAGPPVTEESIMNRLMAGHKDAELSSLLSRFLTECSSATWPGVVPPKINLVIDAPGKPPSVEAPQLSPWEFYRVEPRANPSERAPMFSSLEDLLERERSQSFLGRWIKPKGIVQAIVTIPSSPNLSVAFEQTEKMSDARKPVAATAWMKIGLRLLQAHQIAFAGRAFSRAHGCLPSDPMAINNHAAILLADGSVRPALDILKSGLKHAPESPCLLFNLGLAHFLLRQYREAIAPLRQFGHMKEKTPVVLMLLGQCLFMERQFAQSREAYQQVLEQGPADLNARFNRALCFLLEASYLEAEAAFSEWLNQAPDDADALASRALARWELNRKNEAAADLALAVKKQPSNLALRGLRGVISFLSGRYDKAIEDFEIITRLQPDHEIYQRLLVNIREQLEKR